MELNRREVIRGGASAAVGLTLAGCTGATDTVKPLAEEQKPPNTVARVVRRTQDEGTNLESEGLGKFIAYIDGKRTQTVQVGQDGAAKEERDDGRNIVMAGSADALESALHAYEDTDNDPLFVAPWPALEEVSDENENLGDRQPIAQLPTDTSVNILDDGEIVTAGEGAELSWSLTEKIDQQASVSDTGTGSVGEQTADGSGRTN